jgi:hypothetical protein
MTLADVASADRGSLVTLQAYVSAVGALTTTTDGRPTRRVTISDDSILDDATLRSIALVLYGAEAEVLITPGDIIGVRDTKLGSEISESGSTCYTPFQFSLLRHQALPLWREQRHRQLPERQIASAPRLGW